MKKTLFDEIVSEIHKFHGLSRDCADMLIHKFPMVSRDSLHSILSAEVICRAKIFNRQLYAQQYDHWRKFVEAQRRGEPPGIIVRIAQATNLPPARIARIMFEQHYENIHQNATKCAISHLLRNPTLIEDRDLAYETYLCSLYDDRYGSIADTFASAIGQEYEIKLKIELEKRNMAYRTEEELRSRGYDKTPDVKLEIPVAVDGFIINWIESKARFGTPQIHDTHIEEQFLGYWNRFGPGLVIYWFGFVDEIIQPNEKKFIVMDHFPKNIVYMNPSSLQHLPPKLK